MILSQNATTRWSVIALAIIAICPMVRGTLLVNGSFEDSTSSLSPWVGTGLHTGVTQAVAEDGNNSALISQVGGTLSQTFNVVNPGTYQLTWWDNTTALEPGLTGSLWNSPYSVTIASQVLQFDAREGGLPRSNPNIDDDWVQRTLDISLGAGGQTLTFTAEGQPSGFVTALDNVQLTAIAPVPEPTTLISGAMLLLSFGANTLRFLRKRLVV